MPRGDRTGPYGMGPGTGRGAGFCNGFDIPGFMNPGFAPARGRGFGRGIGFRRFSQPRYPNPYNENVPERAAVPMEQAIEDIASGIKNIEEQLGYFKKALEEIRG